ncbi:MAG: glycine cleavage system protein H [Acidobacteria bacterium]|nr:MAG: glycine cleavage system protein H [Acidobacteriota bacterium]PIE90742.1 MAG: glycine cleavage system protein H [Acidobacteriota bacterium]
MSVDGLYFTKEHEWIQVNGDQAVIGITDHAQSELGDIVFVELPELGDSFEMGEEFGSVESVKAVSEMFSPIDCEVTEINENLEDEPDLVNKSPMENGWMVKVQLSDPSQLESLMSADAYEKFVQEESQ